MVVVDQAPVPKGGLSQLLDEVKLATSEAVAVVGMDRNASNAH